MALPAGVEISGGHAIDQDEVPVVRLDGQVANSTSSLLVETTRASKTYQQVTSTAASATLASLCSGAALPAAATKVELIPSAPIRIRDDGTPTATVGIPVGTNGWDYDRDQLASLKVFGAATIDCWFYA